MRIQNPHTTALVFSSGKMIVTGAKRYGSSLQKAKNAGKEEKKLQKKRMEQIVATLFKWNKTTTWASRKR